MRRVAFLLSLLSLLSLPTIARADGFTDRELAFQALNAIDAAQTCQILATRRGYELNPLLGSHPPCGRVVAFKVAAGALHYAIAKSLNERDAKTFQVVSLVIQGGVVAANFRLVF